MRKYTTQIILYVALVIITSVVGLVYIASSILPFYFIGAFLLLGGFGLYVMRRLVIDAQKLDQWYQSKINYTTQAVIEMKQIGEIAVNEYPFGLLLYRDKSEIAWLNTFAQTYFEKKEGLLLEDLHPHIPSNIEDGLEEFTHQVDILLEDGTNATRTLAFHNDPEYNALYFLDITKETELEEKYRLNRMVVGNLILDNLDELLENEDVHNRVQVQANYFSIIGKWADKFHLYVKSLSDEKFMFVCDYARLEEMKANGFKILDEVRDVNPDSPLKITASIGIGCDDKDPINIGVLVNDAVEQAFTRGGDVVVINIADEPTQYFGGKTETSGKKSRTKSRLIAAKLLQLIKRYDNVIVVTHKNPDQDAFGASLAMLKVAEYAKKKCYLYFDLQHADESVQKMYADLSEDDPSLKDHFVKMTYDERQNPTNMLESLNLSIPGGVTSNSMVVVVDVNNPRIIAGDIHTLPCKEHLVLIDHHRRGVDMYASELTYIEPYASSTVELVVELMQYFEEITLSTLEASTLLTGIFVDTTNFSARTGTRTFDAAAFLRAQGADMRVVKKNLREDFIDLTRRARLLSSATIYNDKYALLVTEETVTPVLLAKLANELLMTNEVIAAFTLGSTASGGTLASARSLDDVNVQLIMEALGGGGHISAAGAASKTDVWDMLTKLQLELDRLKEED